MEINDLFTDLGDGKYLMRLLEIISGERLGRPNSGKMRCTKLKTLTNVWLFYIQKCALNQSVPKTLSM